MNGDAFQAVLFDSLDMAYRELHEAPPTEWRQTYSEYIAQSGKGTYPFFGDIAAVEKFTGTVLYGEVKTYGYEVENDEWGGKGLRFLRSDVERDRIMGLQSRIGTLAEANMEVPTLEIIEALKNGTGQAAYDGVNYFSNVIGARNFDNLLAGTGTTVETVAADMTSARAAMQKFKTDTGRPLNKVPDTIVCPAEMETTFRMIFESMGSPLDDKNAAVRNVARGYVQNLIVSPYLTDVNDWYFLCTRSMYEKPFFWQWERLMAERSSTRSRLYGGGRFRAEVDYNFDERAWYFQVETRGAVGYGLPHFAIKVVN